MITMRATLLALAGVCLLFVIGFICISNKKKAAVQVVVLDGGTPVQGAVVTIAGVGSTLESDGSGRVYLESWHIGKSAAIAAQGFFIEHIQVPDGASQVHLRRVEDDQPDYEWVHSSRGKGNCASCHPEIEKQWAQGAHGNGLMNSRFLHLYKAPGQPGTDPENWSLWHDFPEGRTACVSCHAPSLKPLEEGVEDITQVNLDRLHGIECDFCHKVNAVRNREIGLSHGRDMLEQRRPSKGQVFFGPLKDAKGGDDSYSPIYQDSRYCASCHEGVLFGRRVYSTYSEWLASPAGARGMQCQACHMKADGRMTNIAPGAGGREREAGSLASHDLMPGGKLVMLRSAIGMEVVTASNEGRTGVLVRLLASGVGHRVPTGHVDHHLLLKVVALSDSKIMQPTSGMMLPAWLGKRYEGGGGVVLGRPNLDDEKKSLVPFWKAAREPQDSRLEADKVREYRWEFSGNCDEVRVQLCYRAGWSSRGGEMMIVEKTIKP